MTALDRVRPPGPLLNLAIEASLIAEGYRSMGLDRIYGWQGLVLNCSSGPISGHLSGDLIRVQE